jgi:hypothetical protein
MIPASQADANFFLSRILLAFLVAASACYSSRYDDQGSRHIRW